MKTVRLVICLCLLLAWPTLGRTEERVLSFHSDITVQTDGALLVTETIQVVAENVKIRHGIYRDFPTRYRGRQGQDVRVGFKLLEVKRDGVPEDHHTASVMNGIRIYIGDKETFVSSGEHTYTVSYWTNRQLGFFDDYDELYWNVTGNDWEFPIEKASASVELPAGALGLVRETDAFTGLSGEKGKDFVCRPADNGRVSFETTRTLKPKEGLTLVVAWPKGFVATPLPSEKFKYFVMDHLGAWVGLLGLGVLFLFFLYTWHRVGRDPRQGTIVPLFYPPEGFSPAALRNLMRMGFDNKVVACAVISLAVKGYLTIQEEADGTTILKTTGKSDKTLSPEEAVLARELFGARPVLKLDTANHSLLAKGIRQLKQTLSSSLEKHYFLTNRDSFIAGMILSAGIVVLSIVTGSRVAPLVIFMGLWLSLWTLGVSALMMSLLQQWRAALKGAGEFLGAVGLTLFALPFIAGEIIGIGVFVGASSVSVVVICLAVAVLDVVFYHLLKAPTQQGRQVMDQVEGFKMYLTVAEQDRLKMLGRPQETVELFEQYLPYALALDVEQAWAEQFTQVFETAAQKSGGYHPGWYSGARWSSLGSAGFASTLGTSLSKTISASSVAPGSSSGSRGSGSSGGGGGGGGGGGW